MKLRAFTNITALILMFGASACQQAPSSKDTDIASSEYIAIGQKIVKTQCAVCHSTAPSGESPRADAPPLRTVMANYNPDALADDFRERIHVGHPDMPDFEFTVKEVDGLIAYLLSIQIPQESQE